MSENCGRCKKTNDRPQYSLCTVCAQKERESRQKKEAYRKANKLCLRCGRPITGERYNCEDCLKLRRKVRAKPEEDECWEIPVLHKELSKSEKRKREKEKKRILKQCAKEGISYGKYMQREQLRILAERK